MKNKHAVLGMLAGAIVAFQMQSFMCVVRDLSGSEKLIDSQLQTTESISSVNDISKDPVYWIADEEDDYFERVYEDPNRLTYLRRNLSVKNYFPNPCGHYRFDIERLPTVSVIITVRNEEGGMLSLTVHSILARTPPSLLTEIIIVDDSDDKVADEMQQLIQVSQKVKVFPTTQREGCARSRLLGAEAATGTVLMFADSHIEMLSSTWYQHLVLPIVENPHTITSQHLQVLGEHPNVTYGDLKSRGSHYGVTTKMFHFGYNSFRFSSQKYKQSPSVIDPFDMPFAPGALFAIRRDEFWRLGGYDRGLYVWGGENMELSLKIWLCGGRLVHVPCSMTGHVYRQRDAAKWTLDNYTELIDRLGLNGTSERAYWTRNLTRNTGIMHRIWLRNNIRVAKLWLDDWRKYYYEEQWGSRELFGEWAKFEQDDQFLLEQKAIKEKNRCRDFDWFDKHVYMRLLGIHTPWYASREKDRNKSMEH